MKRVLKYLMMISAAAVFTLMSTGCLRQDYMFFEDGEFDGSSFSDYDLMQNAELEMDDLERSWWLSLQHLFALCLKNIKRRDELPVSALGGAPRWVRSLFDWFLTYA